jgi:hypothetical protein
MTICAVRSSMPVAFRAAEERARTAIKEQELAAVRKREQDDALSRAMAKARVIGVLNTGDRAPFAHEPSAAHQRCVTCCIGPC